MVVIGCYKLVYKVVTWLLQSCNKVNTILSQACYLVVTRLLQCCCYLGIETVNRLGQPCHIPVQSCLGVVQPCSYQITKLGIGFVI